jgi:hypothetical protein
MVVVDLMKIILRGHLLEITLHPVLSEILTRIGLTVASYDARVLQPHVRQLVAQGQPPRHAVVRTTEQLDLLTPRTHPLDQPVHLVRLPTRLPHLAHDHVAVQLLVYLRVSLDPHQAVLLRVVEPVARLASYDQPVYLVCLDPDQLVHSTVPPLRQTLSPQLHGPTSDPEEDEALVLQDVHPQVEQFLVLEGSIGQRHVDIPRRICHHHIELP